MPLMRTTLGRLAAHAASPIAGVETAFSTSHWTPRSPITVSVVSGNLVLTASAAASGYVTRYNAVGVREDWAVYAELVATSGGGFEAGIVARAEDVAAPTRMLRAAQAIGGANERLAETFGGATAQSDGTSPARATPQKQMLWVRGGLADAHFPDPGTSYALTGLTNLAAGIAGLWSSSGSAYTRTFAKFSLFPSWILTVNGPASDGWRARVKDAGGAVIAYADAVDGVAAIDLFAFRVIPTTGVTLEIYDLDAAAVIDGQTATPSERLWGGDAWTYTPPPPATPTGLAATPAAATSMRTLAVSWDAEDDATSYDVERSADGTSGWAAAYTGAATSFTDHDLTPDTPYFYRVRACNDAGCSDWSAPAEGRTLAFLRIAGITVPVAAPSGGTVLAPERIGSSARMMGGELRTTVRAEKRGWRFRTPSRPLAAWTALEAAIATGSFVTCSGAALGATVACEVTVSDADLVPVPGGFRKSFTLTLREA